MALDWLVCDMDTGLLRRERTRRAALAWVMYMAEADKVYQRHQYGPGSYEYSVGRAGDQYSRVGYFIERADRAARSGWAGDPDRPLYPYRDRPYDVDPAVEAEIDAGFEGRSWGD